MVSITAVAMRAAAALDRTRGLAGADCRLALARAALTKWLNDGKGSVRLVRATIRAVRAIEKEMCHGA